MTWNRALTLRLLPVLLALAAYGNTFNHSFVLDDVNLVVKNEHLRSLASIPSYYTSSKAQSDEDMQVYRPLRQTALALEFAVFGLDPRGYHVVNMLLHGANVLLLSLLLGRLGLNDSRASAGAALFAVHPLTTESVANITGQADLLFLLFYLTALLFAFRAYAGRGRAGSVALSLAAYACSLLAKEMAISFVPLLLVLDAWRFRADRSGYRSRLPLYGLAFAVTIAYLLARAMAIELAWSWEYYGDSFWVTMFTETKVIITYLRLFFAPFPLSARYDVALIGTPFNPYTIGVAALLTGLVACTVRELRAGRSAAVLLGFWWFAIALLPVSHLRPIPVSMMGERFLYLPMIGLILSVCVALPDGLPERPAAAVRIALGAVLVILFSLTVARNVVWKDNLALAEDTVAKAPDSLLIRWILFEEYRKRNETAKAVAEYREMQRINEQAAREHLDRAKRYREQGKFADAEKKARRALWTRPDFEEAKEFLRSLGAGTASGP